MPTVCVIHMTSPVTVVAFILIRGNPALACCQLAPPSVLLKTPLSPVPM